MELSRLTTILSVSVVLAGCAATPAPVEVEQPGAAATAAIPADMEDYLSAGRFREEQWRLNLSRLTGREIQDVSVQVGGGLVLVQDQNHAVHGIDLASGVHRWIVQLSGELTRPLGITETSVTMVAGDRAVAVNSRTGARLITQPELSLDFWPSSNGVEAEGSLFMGTSAPFGLSSVDAVGAANGWRYDTRDQIRQVLAVGEGASRQVVSITDDGLVVALPPWPAAGKGPTSESWFRRLRGARVTCGAEYAADRIIVPADDAFVYCIDARTGTVQWKHGTGVAVEGAPVAAADSVYVTVEGELHALDLETGAPRWSAADVDQFITRIDDYCYVTNRQNEVVVLVASNGKEASRFACDYLRNMPVVSGGGVFVCGDGRGNLFALR